MKDCKYRLKSHPSYKIIDEVYDFIVKIHNIDEMHVLFVTFLKTLCLNNRRLRVTHLMKHKVNLQARAKKDH